MMKYTIQMISILLLSHSCNGHMTSSNTKKVLGEQNSSYSFGDPATQIEKSLMVVFQDRNNNYWFGSKENGVYKYDGKSTTHFTIKEGLCNNSILGIQEDKIGNIYIDTQGGVSKFDGQKFTTLKVIEGRAPHNQWKLEPDDLWFRMGWDKNGPYRFDGTALYYLEFPKSDREDEFNSLYPNASFNPYGIYSVYKDRKGTVWFGTSSLGVCRFDGKTVSWLYEKHLTETPEGGSFGIRSIIEDREGFFWYCNTRYKFEILPNFSEMAGTSLVNYKRKNGIGITNGGAGLEFPYFMSVAEDNAGDLWMATYSDGVWRKRGKELILYPVKDGDKNVLLFSIYKDNQGVLWLGTHEHGVYKFNGEAFEKFEI